MKIAFVTPEFVTEENFDGGLANYLARIAPVLAGMGHEVTVLVRANDDGEIKWNGVRVCRVAIGGPPLFFLNSMLRDMRTPLDWLWQSWKMRRALQSLHAQRPFDIVQYASYTGIGLFRSRKIPAVIRLSSYEPLLREAAGVELTKARRLQEWLERLALRRADALFSPSKLVADAAVSRLGRPIEMIESPFAPCRETWDEQPRHDLLEGKRYLLFFGSLSILKGIGTIATILPGVLRDYPDLNFVFAGKDLGDRGRPLMDRLWTAAGSQRGRVHYCGRLPHAQLLPVIDGALVVVLPSRVDNLPNACLEAMAQGRVVIGTRGASFEQLLVDGVSGLLCGIDDPASLRAAVDQALSLSPERAAAMGAAAMARVAELAGPAPLQQLLDFYCDCLDARR